MIVKVNRSIKNRNIEVTQSRPYSVFKEKENITPCCNNEISNVAVHYNPAMFSVLPNWQLNNVSFKGAVLKKSDFKGSDLAVIERYKPNIQQFKSKNDLQIFAEEQIN